MSRKLNKKASLPLGVMPWIGWIMAGLTWAANQSNIIDVADLVRSILENWKQILRYVWRYIIDIIPFHLELEDYQLDALSLILFFVSGIVVKYTLRIQSKPIFRTWRVRHLFNEEFGFIDSTRGLIKFLFFIICSIAFLSAFINRRMLGPELILMVMMIVVLIAVVTWAVNIFLWCKKSVRIFRRLLRFGLSIPCVFNVMFLRPVRKSFREFPLLERLKYSGILIVIAPIFLILTPVLYYVFLWTVGAEGAFLVEQSSDDRLITDIRILDFVLIVGALLSLAVSTLGSMRPLVVTVAIGFSILLFGAALDLAVEIGDLYLYGSAHSAS